MVIMDIKKIIREIEKGNKDAFREIVNEYGPMVRAYLWGKLSDRQVIDDLSQEIFIAVFWNLKSFDINRDFSAWLKAVMKKKLLGHLRTLYSNKNSVNFLKVEINNELLAVDSEFNDNASEVIEKLHLCMQKQTEEDTELITARYFQKESVQSIASRLKSTVDAISCSLYRARRKLKFCIRHGVEL